MVRLFHLNIPKAVALVMDEAIKQERIGHKKSSEIWMNLAEEIEAGRYLADSDVKLLIKQYPFLRGCYQ